MPPHVVGVVQHLHFPLFIHTLYAYSFNTIILTAEICSSLAQMCTFVLATIAINLGKQ